MNAPAGVATLIRLVLRRDRWVLPVWVLLMAAFVAGTTSTFAATAATPQAQRDFVANVTGNPVIVALLGPVLGPGVGGLVAWRIATPGSILVGIIAVLVLVRHTRAEEGAGREELTRSGSVSRFAPLAATLVVIAAAMAVMGLLIGAAVSAQGIPSTGAFAFGLALAGAGWVFTGVAALAAEICASGRTAVGVGVAVLALAVLLRVGADAGGADGRLSWLIWLTPVGWVQQVQPFSGPHWWVFALFVAAAAVLAGGAFALRNRRDVDAGLLADRPGPGHAGPRLAGVLGLAWRQHRGVLTAVLAGYVLVGLLLGAVADDAAAAGGPQLGPFLARLGVADGGEALVIFLIYMLAEVLAAYAIATTLRLRADETGGLAAALLSTPVSRTRWMLGQLIVVLLGTTAVMVALGAAVGLAYGVATGDVAARLVAAVLASLAKVPAVWVLAGLSALLVGVLPRAAVAVSWAALAFVFALEIVWELGGIGDGLYALSPFSWIYPLSGNSSAGAAAGLAAVAVLLGAGGVFSLRRRDLG